VQKPTAPKKKPVAVAKKAAKKPEKVAKTQLVFEVKPEEAETDLKVVEAAIRAITMDGLLWGQEFGTVPVGYGINKLLVQCVVEDEKVSVDSLEDIINEMDGVQSMDMVAMNKM
jgi:translation elongation factor EF-1beta